MRGEVLSYDGTIGTGLISGDDGGRYSFSSAALQSPATPAPGVRVDFVPEGAEATQILILAGYVLVMVAPALAVVALLRPAPPGPAACSRTSRAASARPAGRRHWAGTC